MKTKNITSELAQLLDELSLVQDELLDILATKRDRIADRDLAGTAELQPRTDQLCERLRNCHTRRSDLLAASTVGGAPAQSLGELVNAIPAQRVGSIPDRYEEVSAKVRLLQHQSITNWVLAQRSVLHLSQLLEIIATGGQLQPTYGAKSAATNGGALVDEQA